MKTVLAAVALNVVLLAILLGCAGRADYWPAWMYFGLGLISAIWSRAVLKHDPDLERERLKPGPGAKPWDKKLLGLGFLLTLAITIVAGLDAGRYHWTPGAGLGWSVAGAGLSLLGSWIFLVALKENHYFSSVVRIQTDRGQKVCDTGPYRIIRHPGNAGMILGVIGLPFLFASAWSAIPALLFVALMVVRTKLEDAALGDELKGYRDYQQTVKQRLVPWVW